MSCYFALTKRPGTEVWEVANWMDNYFGQRSYGVMFPDGKIFNSDNYELPTKYEPMKEEKTEGDPKFAHYGTSYNPKIGQVEAKGCQHKFVHVILKKSRLNDIQRIVTDEVLAK